MISFLCPAGGGIFTRQVAANIGTASYAVQAHSTAATSKKAIVCPDFWPFPFALQSPQRDRDPLKAQKGNLATNGWCPPGGCNGKKSFAQSNAHFQDQPGRWKGTRPARECLDTAGDFHQQSAWLHLEVCFGDFLIGLGGSLESGRNFLSVSISAIRSVAHHD